MKSNYPGNARAMSGTRRTVLLSLVAAAIPKWGRAADSWPSKPIKLVHAFAPGSPTDNTGRLLADRISQALGQPVVVENRPGANMIIGTEYAAKQPADGYTMMMGTVDNMVINPNLYRNPGYKASDFDPVTMVGMLPLVAVIPATSKFNTLAELRAEFARTKKAFTFGTWGVGSLAHLVGEMIRLESGLKFEYIPFQGASPAINAILGGHLDITLVTSSLASDYIASNKLKAIAVGSPARLPEIPAVPTFVELGYPKVRATQWHGVFVRAGGNKDIVETLYREVAKALVDPNTTALLTKAGYSTIDARPPAEFAKFIDDDVSAWGAVVKSSGITVDR